MTNTNTNTNLKPDKIRAFDQSPVWNEARKLALAVYRLTKEPEFERDWALRDQVRRAVISIMANIAEGSERGTYKEFTHFLNYASGSCAEVKSHLYLARDLGYFEEARFSKAIEAIDNISRQIRGLQRSLKAKD